MRQTALAVFVITVLLSACGGSDPTQPDAVPVVIKVQAVKVTPQSVQLTVIGETKQLVASISPANATDRALTWESTDPTVASVDGTGLVTARSAGAGVFVTAFSHDGNFQSSANVGVFP
jgi:uncharacterized protein YjdB